MRRTRKSGNQNNMQLQAPPFDADVYRCCDWLELKVLSLADGQTFFADIERAWEARREAEHDDFEGGDLQFDQWLEELCDEVDFRIRSLGRAYPFRFNGDESGICLSSTPDQFSIGCSVYVYCLMLSTIGETQVFEGDAGEITQRMRDLFQACSAWAAGGVLSGSAYAFGWPRPERDDFLTALRAVYHDRMGEGRVVDRAPPGASLQEKDGGIDVIAWASRPDGGPGQPYIIGQVATGANWQEKSVKQYIDPLNDNWFAQKPRSVPQAAMFIPFCIVPRTRGVSLREQLEFYTPLFGNIYYRAVLPLYAERGLQNAAANDAVFMHRSGDLPEVRAQVQNFIAQLVQ